MKKFSFLFFFLTVFTVLAISVSASTYSNALSEYSSSQSLFNGETDTLYYLPDTAKFIDKYLIAEEIYSTHTRFSPKESWNYYKVKEIQFLFSSMVIGDTLKQVGFYKDTLTNLIYSQPVNVVLDSSMVYPHWYSITLSNEFPVISGVVEIPLPMNSFSLCLPTNTATSGNTIGFYDKFQGWGVTGDMPIKLVIEKSDSTPPAKTIQVTFSVNMELERLAGYFHPGSDTVSVGGNFNAWEKSSMTVSQSNSDIYNTTVSIAASVHDTIRFNFCYSPNTWETVGVREFFITQSDYVGGVISLDTIVFNAEFPKPQINLVTFKCNMNRQLKRGTFVIGDKVFVRGDFNGWSGNDYELKDADRDSIYSTVLYGFKVNQSLVFKFTHNHGGTDVWESTGNRMLTVAAGQNIYTACWEDICVYTPTKTIQVAFSINMEYERLSGLFNPLLDTVSVRGSFNNWSKTMMAASTLNPDIYEVVAPVIASVGEEVRFRFFYSPGTWEINNLIDHIHEDRFFVISQADFDATSMSYEASFNNASMETVLNQPASVKFTCNTNGASIINAPQGTEFTTVHIAGEYSPLRWPNSGWPDADSTKMIQLYDDGTHEDAIAGDKIFTTVVTFPTYTPLNIPYKYSANWGLPTNGGVNDNEAYVGETHHLKLGRFTYNETVIDSFGVLEIFDWVEIENKSTTIPSSYKLEQNYPNPFNPETKISWQLAAGSFVTLKVYDVLGNEVATLVNEEQPAGTYQVSFNTLLTTNNQQLTSGIYFYQLRAGNFVQTKKMILLR